MKKDQLPLFDEPAPRPTHPLPAPVSAEHLELAAALPPSILLGTSSWSFPGWAGLVYAQEHTQQTLARHGLAAYAAHPLLRTVGLDRSFYAPVPDGDLTSYARQLPDPFRMLIKVWEEITVPVFPDHPRYGARAGQPNPHFLDVALFTHQFLAPFQRVFAGHCGPFFFEFSPMWPSAYGGRVRFLQRLDDFLGALPAGPVYAVELRNPELITDEYGAILRLHGVSHVFNRWTHTPPIHEQLRRIGGLSGAASVTRLMLPHGATYEARSLQCAPFGALVDVDHEMRADVLDLAREALLQGKSLYVVANNKAEGSAPLTCFALAALIAKSLG